MARRSATLEQLPHAWGLPAVNTPLRLTVGHGPGLPWPARADDVPSRLQDVVLGRSSRRRGGAVDDLRSTQLVVTEPMYPGHAEPPVAETGCLLSWVTEHGLHELATSYLGTEPIGPVLRGWRLLATGQVRRLQRRVGRRVACRLPLTVDGNLGHTLNLSEHGLRAVVHGPPPVVGSGVALTLVLDTGVVSLAARPVYARQLQVPGARGSVPLDRTEVGLRFDDQHTHAELLADAVTRRATP